MPQPSAQKLALPVLTQYKVTLKFEDSTLWSFYLLSFYLLYVLPFVVLLNDRSTWWSFYLVIVLDDDLSTLWSFYFLLFYLLYVLPFVVLPYVRSTWWSFYLMIVLPYDRSTFCYSTFCTRALLPLIWNGIYFSYDV